MTKNEIPGIGESPESVFGAVSLDERAYSYVLASRRRERPARVLARRRDWVGAIRLHLDAAALLMRAKLVASGERRPLDELTPAALLNATTESCREAGLTVPIEIERLRYLLSSQESDVLDRLGDAEAERTADDLATVTVFLSRSIPELAQAQQRREVVTCAAGMTILVLVASGALLWLLLRPTNLALHQPVRAAPAGWSTSSEEAVNGVRFGELGYHSKDRESAWLEVDLTAERALQEVRLYGRGDCCFDQSMPLVVESSADGRTYTLLGRRDRPFKPFRPWVLEDVGVSARYVRVRPLVRGHLVVAELEVY